jgi:dTDP-glucose 4,6-dehydratase
MKVLITGATGFIGAVVTRHLLIHTDWSLRALMHSANRKHYRRLFDYEAVRQAIDSGRLEIVEGDLSGNISGLCERVEAIVHLAAKTFVDHSIRDPATFITNNVVGSQHLLDDARRHGVRRWLQVSTDEVYGPILSGGWGEHAPSRPSNPYAASKAAVDALVTSYGVTYGMEAIIARLENNYGLYQHPQKVIPTFVRSALDNQPLPVYGDGQHRRQWLWVDDTAEALRLLLVTAKADGVYHIAGKQELSNLELAELVLRVLGKSPKLVRLVPDLDIRPGHDRRYALSCARLEELDWHPLVSLTKGVTMAVEWYANNRWWNI